MEYRHWRFWLDSHQFVRVHSDTQCNVLLMDDSDFRNYHAGRAHGYYGGWRKYFPTDVYPPGYGFWNLVIDLDGGRAMMRLGVSVETSSR
jgi:hypothetical protein